MKLCLLALDATNFGVGDGVVVAVTGILTVIFILAVIAVIISVIANIIYQIEHRGEKKILRKTVRTETAPVAEKPAEVRKDAEEETAPARDDSELIAVITAAIAASLDTSSDKLIVRSFKKSANWHKEAINEQRKHTIVI